jgi:hypothetical protein
MSLFLHVFVLLQVHRSISSPNRHRRQAQYRHHKTKARPDNNRMRVTVGSNFFLRVKVWSPLPSQWFLPSQWKFNQGFEIKIFVIFKKYLAWRNDLNQSYCNPLVPKNPVSSFQILKFIILNWPRWRNKLTQSYCTQRDMHLCSLRIFYFEII